MRFTFAGRHPATLRGSAEPHPAADGVGNTQHDPPAGADHCALRFALTRRHVIVKRVNRSGGEMPASANTKNTGLGQTGLLTVPDPRPPTAFPIPPCKSIPAPATLHLVQSLLPGVYSR